MKYKEPSELFKFIIEKANINVINDNQKSLSVALDLLDSEKQYFKLLKIAFKNNVYKELIKAYNSDSKVKTHCINKAIKILTDDCFIDKEKAILAVGWLASVIYLNEWNSINGQNNDYTTGDDEEEIEWDSPTKTSNVSENQSNNREKEHFKDLFEAAEKAKSPQTIIDMVKAGANPNAIDKDGSSVLWYSLKKDSHEITKALVDNGAKINNKITFKVENISYSSTALGLLCFFMGTNADEFTDDYFTVKDIQNLISLGADVNCKIELRSDTNINISPLWCFGANCERKDKYVILECLLKNGADLKYKFEGISFLANYALREESTVRYIDLLVRYGANINETLEYHDEESGEIRQGDVLNFAVWNEANIENIEKIISLGAYLNTLIKIKKKDNKKFIYYPNVILTSFNKNKVNFEILKLLLNKGDDINSTDSTGFHILFYTLDCDDIRKLVVDFGANMYLEDTYGGTFLVYQYLIVLSHFEENIINKNEYDKEIDRIIKIIKACNYDVNRQATKGTTHESLFMTVARTAKHLKTVKAFVALGGKVTSSDNYRILELVSASNQNEDIIDYFASYTTSEHMNDSLLLAAEYNENPDVAKTLIKSILKRGANITQKDSYSGEYLLDIAKRNPNPNVLKTIESNLSVSTPSIETSKSWNVSNSNNYYTTSRDNNYYESTSYVPNNSPSKNNNDFNNGCANGCGCLIWLLIFAACQGCMFLK